MCFIDCKKSEIGAKQLAIHGGKHLFNNEEAWAEARFENNENEIFNHLINSEKHREDLEREFKKLPPQSSILSFKISEEIGQIINLLAIK